MATNKWTSATHDGSSTAAWSLGATPVAADTVLIPKTATKSWTAGLDYSANGFTRLVIEEGCKVGVGTAATHLNAKISASTSTVTQRGVGPLYLDLEDIVAGDDADIRVNSQNPIDALQLTGTHNCSLYVGSGGVTVEAGGTQIITSIVCGSGSDVTGSSTVNVYNDAVVGGPTISRLLLRNGVCNALAFAPVLIVQGGTYESQQGDSLQSIQQYGGTVRLRGLSGAVDIFSADCHFVAGLLDLRQYPSPLLVSAVSLTFFFYPGMTIWQAYEGQVGGGSTTVVDYGATWITQ